MYSFVKSKSESTHISSRDIMEIESKYNIKFPEVLREYESVLRLYVFI